MKNGEGGNVLFLILIAVALFAALSYAMSKSSGTANSSQSKSSELNLQTSQLLQYLASLKQNVLRLKTRGCDITEMSFERAPFDGSDANYINPNSPSDFSCHLFHPDGAGTPEWKTQPFQNQDLVFSSYKSPRFTATWYVEDIGIDQRPELMALIGIVNEDLCYQLNEKLGVDNPSGVLPKKDGSHIHTTYQGVITDTVPAWATWNAQTLESGHHTACVNYEDRSPTNGLQIIYKVLEDR